MINWVRRVKWPFQVAQRMLMRSKRTQSEGSSGAKEEHFFEHNFSRRQLERFLRESGFEVIESVPVHPLFGVWIDFPLFRARGSGESTDGSLTWLGQKLGSALFKVSPWLASHMVMCVARAVK